MTSIVFDRSLEPSSFNDLAARYCRAMLSGLLITTTLFFIMQQLISGAAAEIEPAVKGSTVTFVPMIEEPEPTKKNPKPKPPPAVEPPPETLMVYPTYEGPAGGHGTLQFEPPKNDHKASVAAADGGILPIVAVAPTYPRRMASRGIEGWVLLNFSVDPLGRVQNARVADAQPNNGFNKSALAAISRYKYKPGMVNEKPVWVHDVQTRIVFELENR